MNAAVDYNLERAVTGVSPNYVLDYPKVLFSKGRLAGANAMEVATRTLIGKTHLRIGATVLSFEDA